MTQQQTKTGSVDGNHPLTAKQREKVGANAFWIEGKVTGAAEKDIYDDYWKVTQRKVDLKIDSPETSKNPFFVRCNSVNGAPKKGDYVRVFGFIANPGDGLMLIALRVFPNPPSINDMFGKLKGENNAPANSQAGAPTEERKAVDTYMDSQKLSTEGRLNIAECEIQHLKEALANANIHISQLQEELDTFNPKKQSNTPKEFA